MVKPLDIKDIQNIQVGSRGFASFSAKKNVDNIEINFSNKPSTKIDPQNLDNKDFKQLLEKYGEDTDKKSRSKITSIEFGNEEGQQSLSITYKDGSKKIKSHDLSYKTIDNYTDTETGATGKTIKSYTKENVLQSERLQTPNLSVETFFDSKGTKLKTVEDNGLKGTTTTITFDESEKPESKVVKQGSTIMNYDFKGEDGSERITEKITNSGLAAKEERTVFSYSDNGYVKIEHFSTQIQSANDNNGLQHFSMQNEGNLPNSSDGVSLASQTMSGKDNGEIQYYSAQTGGELLNNSAGGTSQTSQSQTISNGSGNNKSNVEYCSMSNFDSSTGNVKDPQKISNTPPEGTNFETYSAQNTQAPQQEQTTHSAVPQPEQTPPTQVPSVPETKTPPNQEPAATPTPAPAAVSQDNKTLPKQEPAATPTPAPAAVSQDNKTLPKQEPSSAQTPASATQDNEALPKQEPAATPTPAPAAVSQDNKTLPTSAKDNPVITTGQEKTPQDTVRINPQGQGTSTPHPVITTNQESATTSTPVHTVTNPPNGTETSKVKTDIPETVGQVPRNTNSEQLSSAITSSDTTTATTVPSDGTQPLQTNLEQQPVSTKNEDIRKEITTLSANFESKIASYAAQLGKSVSEVKTMLGLPSNIDTQKYLNEVINSASEQKISADKIINSFKQLLKNDFNPSKIQNIITQFEKIRNNEVIKSAAVKDNPIGKQTDYIEVSPEEKITDIITFATSNGIKATDLSEKINSLKRGQSDIISLSTKSSGITTEKTYRIEISLTGEIKITEVKLNARSTTKTPVEIQAIATELMSYVPVEVRQKLANCKTIDDVKTIVENYKAEHVISNISETSTSISAYKNNQSPQNVIAPASGNVLTFNQNTQEQVSGITLNNTHPEIMKEINELIRTGKYKDSKEQLKSINPNNISYMQIPEENSAENKNQVTVIINQDKNIEQAVNEIFSKYKQKHIEGTDTKINEEIKRIIINNSEYMAMKETRLREILGMIGIPNQQMTAYIASFFYTSDSNKNNRYQEQREQIPDGTEVISDRI